MSVTTKYLTIRDYLSDSLTLMTQYSNFTVEYEAPVQEPTRPYARISLQEDGIDIEDEGNMKFVTLRIVVGLNVDYQDETTFLNNIQPYIDNINEDARVQCGIEFLNVSNLKWRSEDHKYMYCEITALAQFYI